MSTQSKKPPETPQMPVGEIEKVSSTYSNVFNVSVNHAVTRLTFGELVHSPKALVHTAIVLGNPDAELLAQTILRTLEQLKSVQSSPVRAGDLN